MRVYWLCPDCDAENPMPHGQGCRLSCWVCRTDPQAREFTPKRERISSRSLMQK